VFDDPSTTIYNTNIEHVCCMLACVYVRTDRQCCCCCCCRCTSSGTISGCMTECLSYIDCTLQPSASTLDLSCCRCCCLLHLQLGEECRQKLCCKQYSHCSEDDDDDDDDDTVMMLMVLSARLTIITSQS